MPEAPHDLKWNINLRLAPTTEKTPPELRSRPVASSSLLWTGSPEMAQPHVRRARGAWHPDSASERTLSFLDLQTMADDDFPHGRRYYTKSGYFTFLDDQTIDRLLDAVATIPFSETIIELAYLGGAAAEVGPGDTAFGDRSAPVVLTLLANWTNPSDDAANISWARGISNGFAQR